MEPMVHNLKQEAKLNVVIYQWITVLILEVNNVENLQKGEKNDVKFAQNCTISKRYFLI